MVQIDLGGNSLLDLVVFGRAAGLHINKALKSGGGVADADKDDVDLALHNLNRLNESSKGYEVSAVKKELQEVMQNYFGVFRRGDYMHKGVTALTEIRENRESSLKR